MGQGDGRDQQVSSANFLQLLVLSQSVKLRRNGGIDGKYRHPSEMILTHFQSLVSEQQLVPIGRLHDGGESPCEDLDARENRRDHGLACQANRSVTRS